MKWAKLRRWGRVYFIPGVVFQAVIIGGGYASGREIVEYVAKFGANGLYAAIVVTIGLSAFLCLTYEFCRIFRTYDYRSLIKNLIWKGFWVFDALFVSMVMLVIAILAAFAGSLWETVAGVPYMLTVSVIVVVAGVLCFYGRKWLVRFKIFGTSLIYSWQVAKFLVVFWGIGWAPIAHTFSGGLTGYVSPELAAIPHVITKGFIYVMYNLVVFFAVLFVLPPIKSRKEAIGSGLFSGIWGTIPLWVTYICYMGFYPSEEVFGAPVPWLPVLSKVAPWIIPFFAITAMYTIIETNAALIHSVLERINTHLKDAGRAALTRRKRGYIAVGIFTFAIFLAQYGIITLVAKGYTYMAYGFMAFFAMPLVFIGILRITRPEWAEGFWKRA